MGFLYQIHECAMQIHSRCCKLGERNATICAHHEPRVFACIQLPLNPKGKKKKATTNIPSRNQVGLSCPSHTLAQIRTEISQSTPHWICHPLIDSHKATRLVNLCNTTIFTSECDPTPTAKKKKDSLVICEQFTQIVETELVTEGIPKEFATQTDTHPWICVWDREKLHKRY